MNFQFTGPTEFRIVLNGIGGEYGEVGARILEAKVNTRSHSMKLSAGREGQVDLRVEQDYYLQAENFSAWKKPGVG